MREKRYTGTVTSYHAVKGQGVITRDDGGDELFVDVFGVQPGQELELKEGARVEFIVIPHTTGPRAEDVVILEVPEE